MIPFVGGSFLNAGGGDLGVDNGDDREDVDRLDPDADVGFRRRGGGESGCMGTALSRLLEPFVFLRFVKSLGRGRGGGVSPPSGWLGSIPKVDSMPIDIGRVDCEDEVRGEWLRLVGELDSRGGKLPEVVRGRYPGCCC